MNIKKRLFKNFFIQHLFAFLAALYILFVKITSNIKIINENYPLEYWKNDKPFILAFWHSQLMMISFSWSCKKKINILASDHSDGRFGALVGNFFNLNNILTSKKNKNISPRLIFNLIKSKNYIGITPDGPRGPKEKVSEGIIKIARNTNIPIIPIGFWSSKKYSLKSWDSFLITLPFSKCCFVWGKAISIPKKLSKKELKNFQLTLENEIKKCVEKAKIVSK